jgi:hypothetical protein
MRRLGGELPGSADWIRAVSYRNVRTNSTASSGHRPPIPGPDNPRERLPGRAPKASKMKFGFIPAYPSASVATAGYGILSKISNEVIAKLGNA